MHWNVRLITQRWNYLRALWPNRRVWMAPLILRLQSYCSEVNSHQVIHPPTLGTIHRPYIFVENVHFDWLNRYVCIGEHLQSDLDIFRFEFIFVKPRDAPPMFCFIVQTDMRFFLLQQLLFPEGRCCKKFGVKSCCNKYLWPLLLTWFNFNPSMDK